MMESRLFCSSSHLGSAAAPLSSLDSAIWPAESDLERTSAPPSRDVISASGDSRKWQTHADGSRKVSTTTSPETRPTHHQGCVGSRYRFGRPWIEAFIWLWVG